MSYDIINMYWKISSVIIIIILLISGCFTPTQIPTSTDNNNNIRHVTHQEINKSVLQKESIKIFYASNASNQKILAQKCLDILFEEYETCAKILNLSMELLSPCSLVFCENHSSLDMIYIDDVFCVSIAGEDSFPFKNSINIYWLYHFLPHEIIDLTLRERGVDPIYGGWFIEGVGEYIRIQCARELSELNNSYWINSIISKWIETFSGQEERTVNLSNRSSFVGGGIPGSPDEAIFYAGSLTFINDLVEKHGDKFISNIVEKNCTTFQDIQNEIEYSIAENVSTSIKNVSVQWIKQKYISLLEKLNINITAILSKEKIRGISVASNDVGNKSSVSDILKFVEECHINMLIVDFGWITWTWNNTYFDEVNTLINASKQKNISTWLMYRARTLQTPYNYLSYQVHKNGEIDKKFICFTPFNSRNWSIGLAFKLLENFPDVDGIILYNPCFLSDGCFCSECLKEFKNYTGIEENPINFIENTLQYDKWMEWRANTLTNYIKEWKIDIATINPTLKSGLVVYPIDSAYQWGQDIKRLGNIVDVLCPFIEVNSVTDDEFAGKICNDTKDTVNASVIGDIKIYGPYLNSDYDIVNAIKSIFNSKGDGFFIWDFDYFDQLEYNLTLIKNAYNKNFSTESEPRKNEEIAKNNEFLIITVFELFFTIIIILIIVYWKRPRKKQ